MKLLTFDTSTDCASVTFAIDEHKVTKEQLGFQHHAQHILPMIDDVLKAQGCMLSEVDGIVIGLGPGSFTGLRIAMSIAKGLAFSNDIPVYGFTTHDIIAEATKAQESDWDNYDKLILVDARMQELYWQVIYKNGSKTEIMLSKPEDILINSSERYIISGVGYKSYLPNFNGLSLESCAKMLEVYPSSAAMIDLFYEKKPETLPLDLVEPFYVRNHVTQGKPHG